MVEENPLSEPQAVEKAKDESKVEVAKREGRNLRGDIAETLADPEKSHFQDEDVQLLKFHGIYQQDNRETRVERKKAGLDKEYMFMIRVAAPGGAMTAEQYLALDEVAESYAFKSLKITTRQAVQLHGVVKGELKATMGEIHAALLGSLAACGDIPRNVTASPAPYADAVHDEVQAVARELAKELAPATGAYHEIWVDGEKYLDSDTQTLDEQNDLLAKEEPIYGRQYLPRKFKIAVAMDFDNSVDAWSDDCSLVAVTEGHNGDRRTVGYNLLVGGGMGLTHNKPETIGRIASPVAFVPAEHAVATVRGVVELYRDQGERSDRRAARIKYLMEKWGVPKFREQLQKRLPFELQDPREVQRPRQIDHLGRHDQGDGRQFYGVFVENGRVTDFDGGPLVRAAFRAICLNLKPGVRLTAQQSILFTDLAPSQVDELIHILQTHGIKTVEEVSNARRFALACVALPTCGLALTDGERAMPGVIDEIEAELASHGLSDVELTIRMTGCPNGCARPYNADIGFVGRKPGVYHVFVGGGLAGDRLADLYAADVPQEKFVETLRPLFVEFKSNRTPGESFGDYYQRLYASRVGDRPPRTVVTGKEEPTSGLIQLGVPASA